MNHNDNYHQTTQTTTRTPLVTTQIEHTHQDIIKTLQETKECLVKIVKKCSELEDENKDLLQRNGQLENELRLMKRKVNKLKRERV